MKNFNLNKLFILLLTVVTVSSCVKNDEFDVPNPEATAVDVSADDTITIDALEAIFSQAVVDEADDIGADPTDPNYATILEGIRQDLKFTFEADGKYATGYVVSSDEQGNFFEELIVQDSAENPTAGVKVSLDSSPLFSRYEFGRKIFVKLDGLTLGLDSGVLTLGLLDAGRIEAIAESQIPEVLLRDAEVATIVPLPLSMSDFEASKTNLFIQLTNVQFNRNQALGDDSLTYAAEPGDQFDGERILESCDTGTSVVFSTSTFADFKATKLAAGRGTINGILTFNFFGEDFNVVVNDLDGVLLNETDRCDPDTYTCNEPSGGGAAFYEENFEQFNAIEDYVNAGWTNVNIADATGELWEIGNFSNNNYAQISGFNTSEPDINTWLVTPGIDMDGTTMEELEFDIQVNFDNGTILTVLFSNNFTGDVTTAEWLELDASIPTGPSGGFGDFQTLGPINIACVEGTMHLAFVYRGSDPDATTRYHIDNIVVTGN